MYPRSSHSFARLYQFLFQNISYFFFSGNHDWEDNPQAQIDFKKDKRWQMKDIYYTRTFGQIQLIFIDTTMLCPEISNMFTSREFPPEWKVKQLAWLDNILKSSKYAWNIIFGHYPVYSGGCSGIMKEMQEINNLFKKYSNVDVYFSGHDHNLQHLVCPECSINYFVSGSGCEETGVRVLNNYTVFGVSIEGFMNCVVRGDVMTVKFVSCKGDELYSVDVQRKVKPHETK